jgi:hypothetical protein
VLLPRFEVVARRRPVRLVAGDGGAFRPVAPYVAVEAPEQRTLTLASGPVTVVATFEESVALHVTVGGRTRSFRSRRSGQPTARVEAVALTLTGPQVTAFTQEEGAWVARARYDLTDDHDVHDESWLQGLESDGGDWGPFGQLGLRDLRVVEVTDGEVLLSATSAGPGSFPTGHASVWALDTERLELEHRADLFFRRDGGVYGDHAAHLLRDGDGWLVAASTWGDFDPKRRPVAVTLSQTADDLRSGTHLLDPRPLALPTDDLGSVGLRSVGQWDPHLARTDEGWLVGFVTATKYFRFGPALASGPDLDHLDLLAADERARETEGTTLLPTADGWRVLASDRRRQVYPVLDLGLRELGTLEAAYPTNLPWPSVVEVGDTWLMVGFNGAPYGGRLVGYGSHGTVVVQRGTKN